MSKISDRLDRIRENIASACARAGRKENRIKLVAVTKTALPEDITEAVSIGCTDLGENRVQHFKQIVADVDDFLRGRSGGENVPEKINWHMIGHLQRNKARQILPLVSLIHSVDTLRLAEEINICAGKLENKADILLQVNCSEEPTKYGVPVGAAIHLAEQISTMTNLRLLGLMTMAPLTLDKDVVRACFVRAREIFEEIRGERIAGSKFRQLSMGMSQDYEIAVEEGATILRIGSAIFSG